MSTYKKIIIEATKCSEEDAKKIENCMRHTIFHSTLDWQTRSQLAEAAQQAQTILVEAGEIQPPSPAKLGRGSRVTRTNVQLPSGLIAGTVDIPADFERRPSLLLLCQVTKLVNGKFEWVIYTDGLYGRGHYPSDSFGAGTIKQAKASLLEHIGRELFGDWTSTIEEKIAEAKKLIGIK